MVKNAKYIKQLEGCEAHANPVSNVPSLADTVAAVTSAAAGRLFFFSSADRRSMVSLAEIASAVTTSCTLISKATKMTKVDVARRVTSSGNYACIYMSDKNAFICH